MPDEKYNRKGLGYVHCLRIIFETCCGEK